ncbi:MAG: hypothetical protein NZ809_01685 [Thermodesulfovibrio sp.]|nr:hypothetical protein [Thermodesulfovibrio sp.]
MKKKFYPDYLVEILFFAIITFELILILAFVFPPQIGKEIDFLGSYKPRPEWYYLWLFFLLRFFPADTVFIGGILIPLVVLSFLIFIPWIDKKIGWRLTALIAFAILVLLIVATLIEGLL